MKTFILRDNQVKERAIQYLMALPLVPVQELDVYEHTKKRSNQQNKLYWAILNELAEASRYSSEVYHEYMKRKFLGVVEIEVHGEIVQVGRSTAKLSTKEFVDYVTQVQVFANEVMRGF